ncbi:acetyl-CoA hydrolase/transferase family protein [Trinickia caryophylli]|uniref:Succinyl-CoA:acetate CoA-transferase n=1 Tax=Trinickia caryophylli TaxID=28094 RepID=A0A1X7GKQ7_TRICW|nr:acetyl-CoA hydrolase/transferase family protein [Trinickia caryophylli]PMS09150.1 propionyl-CoA--succinate CoA transferase [Trinickia caryophylli]TRX14993.1 acetyl-CoA hydrolase/transferase family protein [Trinickia caryophylli]WQE14848.1 acetyl-CoA hydrolase/transferase family protein [Trinickia caryophylli]SMF71285.1 succinyl-CoA:acetate CoA-transferase [Trinickia caryophylli]GLU35055.1 acetyl-CoA hydrolase/transferase [Trinickia caryophylli]
MSTGPSRIKDPRLLDRVMSAEDAARFIQPGMTVAMSGFTGSGYPKAVPRALASRIEAAHAKGDDFRVRVLTGASTAPELDGALAKVNGIELRLPYQSDPILRDQINAGRIEYLDIHLSHVAQYAWFGLFGPLDVALVEVSAIREDGLLVPSSSIGNNKTWLEQAKAVVLEVNSWQPEALDGMHDVYYGTALPPDRRPIPLLHPGDRIGEPYLHCPPEKIVAIVETHAPDRSSAFSAPDAQSEQIAGHLLEFLEHEVAHGRLPPKLLPLQSGVGNITNAVLAGLGRGKFSGLSAYTEVIQDGMLDLVANGTLEIASATALSLSPDATERFVRDIDRYRQHIVLRPQEISNHPELVRRLGCIAMNGMIEADIYGNVNSTHVMGSRIQNGIGGSGDFARNGYLSCFMSTSTAKNGSISRIVPMVSHVDHTEHDVSIVVTEQGLADLRGLSPKQRARQVIARCAHPAYRPMLEEYFERACSKSFGKHTPHLLDEALSWHQRYVTHGTMRPDANNSNT